MERRFVRLILVSMTVLGQAWMTQAQDAKTLYPAMAPLNQYLMADRSEEIALARSAGPKSISDNAEVLVLGPHGYETAVKGTNGFVCLVERAWTEGVDDPEFWSPKVRGPLCLNAAAVQTYLPITIMKTQLALSGRSKEQITDAVAAAVDQKKLPAIAPGAMSYMLSKDGHLNDGYGHWRPHLMFFVSATKPADWGAGLPGSPLMAIEAKEDRMTIFLLPVAKWSDGTPDSDMPH
jgi:hypothetical protein